MEIFDHEGKILLCLQRVFRNTIGDIFNFLLKNQKLFFPCFMRHYFNFFQAWNVNWETRHMMIQFEDDKNVIFQVNHGKCLL